MTIHSSKRENQVFSQGQEVKNTSPESSDSSNKRVITRQHADYTTQSNRLLAMPKVPISVIIPSYNHGSYLEEALESVLDQSSPPEEIIVVDDGSVDNSVSILKKYSKHIKLSVNVKNMGAALTTNIAIGLSSRRYLCLLNSDDRWKIDKLERQFDYLKTNNLNVCFGLADIMDEKSTIIPNPPFEFENFKRTKPRHESYLKHFFYNGNFLCHPSLMIEKEIYKRTGTYDNRFRQLPDLDLWVRIVKDGWKVGIIPEPIIDFRWTPGTNTSDQTSFSNFSRTQNEHLMIFRKFFNQIERGIILETFKMELLQIPVEFSALRKISPAAGLLLFHPDRWLAPRARLAGLEILWSELESFRNPEVDLMVQKLMAKGYWNYVESAHIDENSIKLNELKGKILKMYRFLRNLGDFK